MIDLTDLGKIFDCVGDTQNKHITFRGDFNVIFYSFLEVQVAGVYFKHESR